MPNEQRLLSVTPIVSRNSLSKSWVWGTLNDCISQKVTHTAFCSSFYTWMFLWEPVNAWLLATGGAAPAAGGWGGGAPAWGAPAPAMGGGYGYGAPMGGCAAPTPGGY